MTSPRWRRWGRNAQPSPDQTRDRPRPLRLCDAAFRQSRARQQKQISVDAMEKRPRFIQKLIWQSLRRALTILYASLTHMSLGFWALYERSSRFRWDATSQGDPTRRWPLHSVPVDQSRDRHPRRSEPIWARGGICAGTRESLGLRALARRAASDSVAGRLGSRLPRGPFLAQAQAVLPAREGTAAFDRCASAFTLALLYKLLSGAASGPYCRFKDPAWLVRAISRPRHDGTPAQNASPFLDERYADARLPGRSAGRDARLRQALTMAGAPRLGSGQLTYPDPHDSRSSAASACSRQSLINNILRMPMCSRRPRPLLGDAASAS